MRHSGRAFECRLDETKPSEVEIGGVTRDVCLGHIESAKRPLFCASGGPDEMGAITAEVTILASDASTANVNRFIDAMLTESDLAEDRNRFRIHLTKDINACCRNEYGNQFAARSPE